MYAHGVIVYQEDKTQMIQHMNQQLNQHIYLNVLSPASPSRFLRTWIAFLPHCPAPSGLGLPFSLVTWIVFLPQDFDCICPTGL